MKLHKYYSILRPVMPGSYPNHDVVQVVNFDDRMYCEDIGEKAWELVQDIIERIFVGIDCLIVYQPHDAELRKADIERRYR